MSRSTQWIGLTTTATEFIEKNCYKNPVVTCECCGHSTGGEFLTRVDRHTDGMFDEKLPLHTYFMHSPSDHEETVIVVKEVVQCEPWSSGPMIFTHLELPDGSFVGSWTDSQINSMI
jgi:hypothetical protein